MKKIVILPVLLFLTVCQIFAITISDDSVGGVDRYAIYIGANNGGKNREKLLYAGSDAVSFKNAMSEIGGVTEANSRILIDPSKESIDAAIKDISTAITSKSGHTKRSEFIFYYSGHSDENALLLGESKYDYSKLKAAITEVPSDIHVVILDSCYSGNFIRTKGGQHRKPFLIDDSSVVTGHAYLSSSSDKESSQESDEIESSYFTNAMITGLRGAADASGDNKVTLNELYSYAFNDTLSKTEASKAGPQHPNYNITLVGSGDLILSDLSTADAMLSLSKEAKGRFIIRDAHDKLISEINKTAGQPVFIALPVGQYSALIIDEYSTKQGTFLLERDQVYVLDQNSLGSIKRKSNRLRGDSLPAEEELPELADNNEDDEETLDLAGLSKKRTIVVEHETSEKQTRNVKTSDEDFEVEPDFSNFYGIDVFVVPGVSFVQHDAENLNFALGIIGSMPNNVYGLNYSNIFNISTGNIFGCQYSSSFNIGLNNISGAQIAGIFNLGKGIRGAQIAGVFNQAIKAHGAQIAGVYNLSQSVDGIQIAGVTNIADDVNGMQIGGVFNLARNISGIQIGLINVAEENDGISLGLFNFIGNGLMDIGTLLNSNGIVELFFQNGTKHLYNIIGAAWEVSEDDFDVGYAYFGLGTEFDIGFTSLELEFLCKMCWFNNDIHKDYYNYLKELPEEDAVKELVIPCFRVNWNFLSFINAKLFVNVSLDYYDLEEDYVSYELQPHRWVHDSDDCRIAPSVAIGCKFRI